MLIASLCLADQLVTLVAATSLNLEDNPLTTYILTFTDIATGNRRDVVYTGENDAIYAVAAWIVADSEALGDLEPHRAELEKRLGCDRKAFLP